tara:strand:+ start:268 stop:543 length:276 start_codon:yes stop_codon:yes gene_type:complete
MKINEDKLTRGQVRKLNALRKSLGDKIANEAFEKWLTQQKSAAAPVDPVAEKIAAAISVYQKDKSFKLGNKGYLLKRNKGRGAVGFVVKKV